MTDEETLIDAFAKSEGMNVEMFGKVVGDEPLWIGADPVGGWIILVVVVTTAVEIARWTAVQGENVKILHDRAMSIVASGVGSMR